MIVVTARDIAIKNKYRSVREMVRATAARMGIKLSDELSENPVTARIDHGRWIADCECKGAEYVDPDEPIFFCASCKNAADEGRLRSVKFPPAATRKKIEKKLNEATYFSWNETEEPYGV